MVDPGQDAHTLSVNTINVMANSVFGDIAGPVVSDELLGMLGLGSGSDSHVEEYFQKIQSQLATMEDQIIQLQTSVTKILDGIAVIQEQITGVEVQQKLQIFSDQATVVKQNFQSYVDAIGGLATGKADKVESAATDLFSLLQLLNLQAVATAMSRIQEAFLPSLSEEKGLLALQHDVVRGVIVAFAADGENFRIKTNPPHNQGGVMMPDALAIPSGDGVFRSAAIATTGHDKASEQLKSAVADTFKAFITVQTQGLILLNTGWLGSIHEGQIIQQVNGIQRVLDAMKGFEADVVKTIDDQVAASLQGSGKRLTGYAASNFIQYDYGWADVRWQYPLSDDWVMWDCVRVEQGWLLMAYKPWTYQPCLTAALYYDYQQHIFIARSDDPHWAFDYSPGSLYVVQAPRYAGIPSEFAFIRNL